MDFEFYKIWLKNILNDSHGNPVLLVEGETDVEYYKSLLNKKAGDKLPLSDSNFYFDFCKMSKFEGAYLFDADRGCWVNKYLNPSLYSKIKTNINEGKRKDLKHNYYCYSFVEYCINFYNKDDGLNKKGCCFGIVDRDFYHYNKDAQLVRANINRYDDLGVTNNRDRESDCLSLYLHKFVDYPELFADKINRIINLCVLQGILEETSFEMGIDSDIYYLISKKYFDDRIHENNFGLDQFINNRSLDINNIIYFIANKTAVNNQVIKIFKDKCALKWNTIKTTNYFSNGKTNNSENVNRLFKYTNGHYLLEQLHLAGIVPQESEMDKKVISLVIKDTYSPLLDFEICQKYNKFIDNVLK